MSKTIDQRVVEMQFDNARFERNVQTSMSTLAKLKQSLNLTGAAKGLEAINTAAKSNNISALGTAADTVGLRFSAMYTVADQALRNITTRVMHTAESMVKALTFDPITTGLQEYETQINAVQTILANTSSKGTTIDDVNAALKELNDYADKTIYNFTEMTRNIGTFTAAGVDLDTSVSAIQGIANLAAVSGSTSQQASTAMYQLSQALATGTVKLMDWNSVVNAGMGGEVFQNALIRTAAVMAGSAEDVEAWRAENIDAYGSFRDSLTEGAWLTTDVLTATLEQFTMATEGLSDAEIEAHKAQLRSIGYTEQQIEEILKMANTATDAATKVKTFTQLWDVLKESAQSGWSQTWQLIIGDFEQAKSFLTPVADSLTGIINKMSNARNNLLRAALDSPFGKLFEKIEKVSKATEKVVEATLDYGKVVDKVLGGEYGTGQSRWNKLAEEGYNWAKVQNMVNEKLGDSTRHNEELAEAQIKANKAQSDSNEVRATTIEQLAKMTDDDLREIGFTDEEIESFRLLAEAAEKAGYSLETVLKNPELMNGRNLLIDGFKNIGRAIASVVRVAKDAWQDIFPPKTLEERAEKIYLVIAAFRGFTDSLILTGDNAEYFKRTLKGVFAAIDIVLTVVGGPLKWAFDAIVQLLGKFDINILEYTANIGDAIVKLRDWIDEHNLFLKAIEFVAPYLKKAIDAVKEWANKFKETHGIGEDLVRGLINGVVSEAKKAYNKFIEFATKIINIVKGVFDEHSPSKVFFMIGAFLVIGLISGFNSEISKALSSVKESAIDILTNFANGIVTGAEKVYNAIKNFTTKVIDKVSTSAIEKGLSSIGDKIKSFFKKVAEFISEIDFGKLFAAGLGAGMLVAIIKIANAIEMLAGPLDGLGEMFEGLSDMFQNIGKNFKAAAFEKRMNGVYSFAKAIGVLALSIFLLASIPAGKLWATIGAIAVLSAIMAGLALLANQMSKNKKGVINFDFGLTATGILLIAAALLILASTLKKLSSIESEDIPKTLLLFGSLILGLSGFMYAYGKFVKGKAAQNMNKAGVMLLKIAAALLIMTYVIKLAGNLDGKQALKGVGIIAVVSLLFAGLIAISKFAGKNADKAGSMILKMSLGFLAMIAVIKLASDLNAGEVRNGLRVISEVGILFAAIMAVSKLAGGNAGKAGAMMLMMSLSMLVIVEVIKSLSGLNEDQIHKGLGVVAALGILFAAVIAVSHFAGQHAVKAGVMLLLMSGTLIVLTGVLYILSKISDSDGIYTALGIVLALGIMFAALIAVTSKAQKVTGTLILMTIAISLMVSAIWLLSEIDDPRRLLGATLSLSLLIGVFALLVKATSSAKDTVKMGAILAQLLGVVIVLGLVVAALSLVDATNALPNTLALSVLLLALSTSMVIISNARFLSEGIMGKMLLLGLVVAELGVILAAMSFLPNVDGLITTAISLGILLNAMAAAMLILDHVTYVSAGTIGGMALLGLVVAELGVIFWALQKYNVQPSIETALALGILLNCMAVALGILSAVGAASTMAIPATLSLIAVVGLIGAAIIAFGEAVGSIDDDTYSTIMLGLDRIGEIFVKLGEIVGETVGAVIDGFLNGVGSGMADMGTYLSKFMENARGFIDGLGGIKSEHIDAAGMLVKMLLAITAADLISGITNFVGLGNSSITTFSEQLVPFGEAMAKFSETVNGKINEDAVKAAASAGLIMVELAKEIPNSGGILGFIMGNNDLATFGLQLVLFGKAICNFSNTVGTNGINMVAVEAAQKAGLLMTELAKEVPNSGGLLSFIMGDNDLATFGIQLVLFGKAICNFSKTVSENPINETAVKAAADAGLIMTELAKEIPNTGGLLSFIMGDNDLATFGIQLVLFGKAICNFSKTVTENPINGFAVEAAAKAGEVMVALAKDIPTSGGLLGLITGNQGLGKFGDNIKEFGKGIAGFAKEVGDGINIASVGQAISAATLFLNLDQSISDGAYDGMGDCDAVDLAQQGKKFGKAMGEFADAIADVNFTNMSNCLTNATRFANFCITVKGLDTSGIATFKSAMSSMASAKVSEFTETFSVNFTTYTTRVSQLTSMITKLAGLDTSGVSGFKNAINTLGQTGVKDFIKAFSDADTKLVKAGADMMTDLMKGITSKKSLLNTEVGKIVSETVKAFDSKKDDFKKLGATLMTQLANGIESKKSSVTSATGEMAKAGKDKIRDYYDSFKSAGSYLVSGFAAGISENDYKATAKAKAMAKAAKQAAEEALGIESPSKVFYGIGEYVVAGFVNALSNGVGAVDKASTVMADSARSGFTAAIIGVTEALNTDMDLQPTIRPVLDLSSVRSSVGTLNGMFDSTRSIHTMANLRAINATIGQNGQNGNDDVVSAINRLGRKLDNVGNTSYNIAGITYDDGSNIADALETITRVAKIARRT